MPPAMTESKITQPTKSVISKELIDEYRATHFQIGEGIGSFTLRIDIRSDSLAHLLSSVGRTCAVFITAYNPCSQLQSADENKIANIALAEELRRWSDHVIAGIGINPSGTWVGEPGYLALGVDLASSRVIGAKFRQNAIIWAGEDAVARLILLR
jgi:hypothetical protein